MTRTRSSSTPRSAHITLIIKGGGGGGVARTFPAPFFVLNRSTLERKGHPVLSVILVLVDQPLISDYIDDTPPEHLDVADLPDCPSKNTSLAAITLAELSAKVMDPICCNFIHNL